MLQKHRTQSNMESLTKQMQEAFDEIDDCMRMDMKVNPVGALNTIHAEMLRLTRVEEELRALCAATYQAAGCYGLPVRFLDALSNAMNNEHLHDVDLDKLLPVDPVDWVERAEKAEAEIEILKSQK